LNWQARPRAYESYGFSQEFLLRIDDIPEGEIARLVCGKYTLALNFLRVPCSNSSISCQLSTAKRSKFFLPGTNAHYARNKRLLNNSKLKFFILEPPIQLIDLVYCSCSNRMELVVTVERNPRPRGIYRKKGLPKKGITPFHPIRPKIPWVIRFRLLRFRNLSRLVWFASRGLLGYHRSLM